MIEIEIERELGWVGLDMELGWLSALLVGAGCLAMGYLVGASYPCRIFVSAKHRSAPLDNNNNNKKTTKNNKDALDVDKLADILDDFKMVFVLFDPLDIKHYM